MFSGSVFTYRCYSDLLKGVILKMTANDNNSELPDAAKRALAEAAERGEKQAVEAKNTPPAPKEILGRDGPDPIRFGDWEKDGITSDF